MRLNLGVMIFVLSFLNFTMNVSLSIAIIAMTESKNDTAIQSDDEVLVVSIVLPSRAQHVP